MGLPSYAKNPSPKLAGSACVGGVKPRAPTCRGRQPKPSASPPTAASASLPTARVHSVNWRRAPFGDLKALRWAHSISPDPRCHFQVAFITGYRCKHAGQQMNACQGQARGALKPPSPGHGRSDRPVCPSTGDGEGSQPSGAGGGRGHRSIPAPRVLPSRFLCWRSR